MDATAPTQPGLTFEQWAERDAAKFDAMSLRAYEMGGVTRKRYLAHYRVRDCDSGKVYDSPDEAARIGNSSRDAVYRSLRSGERVYGRKFEKVKR